MGLFNRNMTMPVGMPNPKNYSIVKSLQVGNNLVLLLHYPDCNNYEGRKILVYRDVHLTDLIRQKEVDPHFSEEKGYSSPFARFEPTDAGWSFAVRLAEIL